MFCRMLRDDGNRMANVRRDHKVKVKKRDKLGKVSDAPRRRLENRTKKGMRASEGRIRESNREMDVAVTGNISRENRRAEGAGRIIAILPSGLNNAREDYGVRRGDGKSGKVRLGCRRTLNAAKILL